MITADAAYRALTSRDARFDGVFFTGVTSTGIYCRPICPVKTPRRKNCRFFASAEAAENAGFRPCLRCRPELAPGLAPVDQAHRVARQLVRLVEEGQADEGEGIELISQKLGLSSRQLRRIVRRELGVTPTRLLQTRRLLLSKQLLTETRLPVTEIAFASGFSSLRRFNDAFVSHYRMPPTRLRRKGIEFSPADSSGPADATDAGRSKVDASATLQLAYRPPYDWEHMLGFLRGRAIRGVEFVGDDSYLRTVRLGRHTGWIRVSHAPAKRALLVEFSRDLMPALPAILGRLRNLFDLEARPDVIAAHLARDPLLKAAVARRPGLRVPGAFDGFEMALRAILGQQVTVKAATTLAGRLAEKFGGEIATPFPELTRLTPPPDRVAAARVDAVAALGVPGARARAILALAEAFADGSLKLDASANPQAAIDQLNAFPGIGPWTAHYLAMRGLRWPDAFPKEDIAVRNNLGGVSARRAEELSRAWSPWRSYAVMHIWQRAEE